MMQQMQVQKYALFLIEKNFVVHPIKYLHAYNLKDAQNRAGSIRVGSIYYILKRIFYWSLKVTGRM